MADDQRFFFLDLTAAGVHGGSQKTGHTDWLELDNWDFSMNQMADANIKGGRPSKTAATGRFGFAIKHNGPQLFKLASTGQFLKPVLARHGRKPERAAAKTNGSVRPRRAAASRNRVAVG